MPRASTESIAGGRSAPRSLADGTGSSRWAKIAATSDLSPYGTDPVRHSKTRQARLYWSAAAADVVAADLLGRDVGHRSHELAVGRTALRCALRESEIREITVLALVLAVQQHVARLHVAMDQAAAVSGIESPCQLLGDRDRALGREGSLSPQHRLQISARHVTHGDEEQPVLVA